MPRKREKKEGCKDINLQLSKCTVVSGFVFTFVFTFILIFLFIFILFLKLNLFIVVVVFFFCLRLFIIVSVNDIQCNLECRSFKGPTPLSHLFTDIEI